MLKISEYKIQIGKKFKDAEIARLCGVTRQTVYNWRHGKSRPTQNHLQKLKILAK